jgi:hypothetical protein
MGTEEALRHFGQVCEDGVQPNDITFIVLCQFVPVMQVWSLKASRMITWTKGFLQHWNIMWQS